MPAEVIFVDDAEFGLAAYDADDGLSKQMALRFTARGGSLCENVEDASFVIIDLDKVDWRAAVRTYVSGNRIALASGWIDACIKAGRALLEDDHYAGFRLELHDAPPGPKHRTPLPTPRTTPTSSAPNMPPSHQSPQYQPTPGHLASPSGQQAGSSGGYYQGQSPVAASFPHPRPHGFNFDPNLLQGFVNQFQQHGISVGQPAFMPYPQSQPARFQQQYQQQYQQQQIPVPSQNSFVAPSHPQFMVQYSDQLLKHIPMQQAQAVQLQQELQTFDLNNPLLVDTIIAVAQHRNQVAAEQILQALRACQPRPQAPPMGSSSPSSAQPMHTSYSPAQDNVFGPSAQPTLKRKSEQMVIDDDEAPVAPRKVAKKPSLLGSAPSAKEKGKQKAVPTSRPTGPSSRKTTSSTDLRSEASGSGEKPIVKQEKKNKGNIFTKRNGSPMSIYVLDGLYAMKRPPILAAVKAHGGLLLGAGRIEEADFCVMDRSTSRDRKKLFDMAAQAEIAMVNADFVPKCVEAGKLLRYHDFPPPHGFGTAEAKSVGRPSNSFLAEEKPRKSRKGAFFDDDEEDSDDSPSDEEPAPRKKTHASTPEKRSDKPAAASPRGKGRLSATGAASSSSAGMNTRDSMTVKSAKEQSVVKEPKPIPKPKITAQAAPKPVAAAKSVPKPSVVTSTERDSPNPPQPKKFDGKRYKFTNEEMEWAWVKLARMAQQDEFLTLAKASEGLAKKTPHHSASSWRGKLERDLDKFEEIRADADASKTVRPPVSSPGSAMPPKLRVNSSSSVSQTGQGNEATVAATTAATAQPMQVDEPAQSTAPPNEESHKELSTVQPGGEDDFERAVSFLMTYEPPEPVEHAGDECIWPVLNRTLAPCESRPSWQEFWEKYENTILQGVRERVAAAN